MPPDAADSSQWFVQNVRVHEAGLRSYLRSRFPTLPDIDDLVQESFLRIVQAHQRGPIGSTRALLFTTARNLALDYFRRRQVASIDGIAEFSDLPVIDEAAGVLEIVGKHEELELLTEAIQQLPDRCRQVLTLRKIYGLSQKEIAAQLGVAEHTVEAQVGVGMRRCAAFLARHGLP